MVTSRQSWLSSDEFLEEADVNVEEMMTCLVNLTSVAMRMISSISAMMDCGLHCSSLPL
jgi:hypothetical protein